MNANYKIERTENGIYLVKIEKGKKCTFTLFNKLTKEVTTEEHYFFDYVTESINGYKELLKKEGYKIIDVTKENVTVKSKIDCDIIPDCTKGLWKEVKD